MKTPFSLEYRARCYIRLGELSHVELVNLTEFAERRLVAQGLIPSAGEDVTQLALLAILQGLEPDQGGRVPRLVDLENKDTFQNYVRGAISSIVEAMGRKRMFRSEHKPWRDELRTWNDESVLTPSKSAEMSDLRDQLFPRLRAQAPRRLWRSIDAWESVFGESDRIPARGHRRYVREVRELARAIISELGGIR
jgi:hypothetical protein